MTLIVKFACEGQYRRVRVESLSWEQIVTAFVAGFPELKQDTCDFKYRDDEGDLCLLSTSTFPDFAELFRESASVRVEVAVRMPPAADAAEPHIKPGQQGCWPGGSCLGDLLADLFLPRLKEALEHVPREHAKIEGLAHWQPQLVRRAVQALYDALEPFPQMKEAREGLWRLVEAAQLTGIAPALEMLLQSLARLPSEEQRNVASAALGHMADVFLGPPTQNPIHDFFASLLGMQGTGQGNGFVEGRQAADVLKENIERRKAAKEARMKILAAEKAKERSSTEEASQDAKMKEIVEKRKAAIMKFRAEKAAERSSAEEAIQDAKIERRRAAMEARMNILAAEKAEERSSAEEAIQDSVQSVLLRELTDLKLELTEVGQNVQKLIGFHDAAETARVKGKAQRIAFHARMAEARRESQEASPAVEANEETQAAAEENSEMNQAAADATSRGADWQILEADAVEGP